MAAGEWRDENRLMAAEGSVLLAQHRVEKRKQGSRI